LANALRMSNESWQSLSQACIAVGIALTALGGFGAFHFSKRMEHEKEAQSAYTGRLKAKSELLLSGPDHIWPRIEMGDSGATFIIAGKQGIPLFSFGEDSTLTVVREDGQVKVSTIIRDKAGRVVAELIKNEWKINPQNSYDRNYTEDALEVKDPSGDIVLQVRALPDRVQLQAKLYNLSGRGFAFGKMPGAPGGIIDFTGPKNPELRLRIEPIFEYPSDLHLGQLRERREETP